MERNHDKARRRFQTLRDDPEERVDVVELAIHPDSKRLKCARRGIDPRKAMPRDRFPDDRGELRRRLERRRLARLHDASRDTARKPLLTELVDRIRDLFFFGT